MNSLQDFAPDGVEAGVGLAIEDGAGRYLFFLAGARHRCPPGALFYAGIGGHREEGERWLECAQREATEEIGTGVEILPASHTWCLLQGREPYLADVADAPRPLALYEMIHPQGTPRAGELYRIVVYRARLQGAPREFPPDEVSGLIALTREHVIQGVSRKPTLESLVAEGAAVVPGPGGLDRKVKLYPLGTAVVLAHVLRKEERLWSQ